MIGRRGRGSAANDMQVGFFEGWSNVNEYREQLIHVALNLAFQSAVVGTFLEVACSICPIHF